MMKLNKWMIISVFLILLPFIFLTVERIWKTENMIVPLMSKNSIVNPVMLTISSTYTSMKALMIVQVATMAVRYMMRRLIALISF